jgi:DNA-binding IclR family transcriptional regulator
MTKSNTPTEPKTISSLETGFDIVELVAANDGMTPRELSERLDYSRSTIHYYLTTLEKHRFLTRGEDGYRIGFRFLHYGNHALRSHDLTGVVEREVERLAEETGATALFAIQQQGRSVVTAQSFGGETSEVGYYVGREQYLHGTAFGRALLAHLPTETLDRVVERHGLPDAGAGAVTDRESLAAELDAVREQGFAYGEDGFGEGTRAIAAPIVRERSEETVGAIGIVGGSDEIGDPRSHIKAQRFAERPATMVKRYAQILRNKVT